MDLPDRGRTPELAEYLFQKARDIRIRHYGRDIFIRGLIEFTSYCRNDCYYCGIRCSNKAADRYRLTKEDILACCKTVMSWVPHLRPAGRRGQMVYG